MATTRVVTAHAAELDPPALTAVRRLLDSAFDSDPGAGFSNDDWDHTLGGMHALVWEGAELVGHGAVVQRRLLHGGRSLRTGYVEGVAVRADRRGRGLAHALMQPLEQVVRAAYELGALSASDNGAALYERRGWLPWLGPSSVLTPTGVRRTPDDDGSLFVLPVSAPLDRSGDLVCDWRSGDVW